MPVYHVTTWHWAIIKKQIVVTVTVVLSRFCQTVPLAVNWKLGYSFFVARFSSPHTQFVQPSSPTCARMLESTSWKRQPERIKTIINHHMSNLKKTAWDEITKITCMSCSPGVCSQKAVWVPSAFSQRSGSSWPPWRSTFGWNGWHPWALPVHKGSGSSQRTGWCYWLGGGFLVRSTSCFAWLHPDDSWWACSGRRPSGRWTRNQASESSSRCLDPSPETAASEGSMRGQSLWHCPKKKAWNILSQLPVSMAKSKLGAQRSSALIVTPAAVPLPLGTLQWDTAPTVSSTDPVHKVASRKTTRSIQVWPRAPQVAECQHDSLRWPLEEILPGCTAHPKLPGKCPPAMSQSLGPQLQTPTLESSMPWGCHTAGQVRCKRSATDSWLRSLLWARLSLALFLVQVLTPGPGPPFWRPPDCQPQPFLLVGSQSCRCNNLGQTLAPRGKSWLWKIQRIQKSFKKWLDSAKNKILRVNITGVCFRSDCRKNILASQI